MAGWEPPRTSLPGGPAAGPLGHLARLGPALVTARGLDALADLLFPDLLDLPGMTRVGFAVVEGGGRRLVFTSSDRGGDDGSDRWCHIDAFEDVPLNGVVRTGSPVVGALDELDARYAEFAAGQAELGVSAICAVPILLDGAAHGGLLAYLEGLDRVPDAVLTGLRRSAEIVTSHLEDQRARAPRGEGPMAPRDAPYAAVETLPGDTTASARARAFLRESLGAWGVPDTVRETAELLLSELVTNAVLHAGTASELRVAIDDDELIVQVRDAGSGGQPVLGDVDIEDPLAVHGRGLLLVEALSERWGSERDEHGATAWFVLTLPMADLAEVERRPQTVDATDPAS